MKSGRDLRVVPPADTTRVHIGEPENLPERFAHRAQGMKASEIRALFAVASRPEIVSLAGGVGGLAGPALAALILYFIPNILLAYGIDPAYSQIITGALTIFVVLLGGLLRRRTGKK